MFILDRFEEKYAVLENLDNGETFAIHRDSLPHDIQVGDALYYEDESYHVDCDYTQKRWEHIREKAKKMWK